MRADELHRFGQRELWQHDVAKADHVALAVEVERAAEIVRWFGFDAGGLECGVGFVGVIGAVGDCDAAFAAGVDALGQAAFGAGFVDDAEQFDVCVRPNMMQWLPVPLPSCRPRGVSVRPSLR